MFGLKGWLKSVGSALGVRPPQPPPLVDKRPPPAPESNHDAANLLAATNECRRDNGRSPLKFDARLADAAWRIARDNARRDKLSHDGDDGSDPLERITAAGFPALRASENGFTCDAWPGGPESWGTAHHAVIGWANSTVGHRENLLGDWSHMGGAKAVADDGSIYWFCCYGTPR